MPPPISKPIDPDLISTEVTAGLLGCGHRKVIRLANKGKIPAPTRYNEKCILFSRREIEAFIAERDEELAAKAEAKATADAEKAARPAKRKAAAVISPSPAS